MTDNNSPHARTHAHTDTIQLQVNVHIQNPLCVYSLFTEEYNGKYLCQFAIILPRQGQKNELHPWPWYNCLISTTCSALGDNLNDWTVFIRTNFLCFASWVVSLAEVNNDLSRTKSVFPLFISYGWLFRTHLQSLKKLWSFLVLRVGAGSHGSFYRRQTHRQRFVFSIVQSLLTRQRAREPGTPKSSINRHSVINIIEESILQE